MKLIDFKKLAFLMAINAIISVYYWDKFQVFCAIAAFYFLTRFLW